MIYQCNDCDKTTFETYCPWCSASDNFSGTATSGNLTPLDPSFYPDFQYQSKGILKDFLGKKKEMTQLSELLQNVLEKYQQLKDPYFINYIHTSRDARGSEILHNDGTWSERELFQEVLIRKGFTELESQPSLLDKLLLTTSFNSLYAGFSRELTRHAKSTLSDCLESWIEEAGTTFRDDLSLFFYFFWKHHVVFPNFEFNPLAATTPGTPLLPLAKVKDALRYCEKIYFDILVNRLAVRLEHFNPDQFVTLYRVDAMDGFQFEDFLVKVFQTIGYDVQETRKTADQGADLFVTRFGRTMVIQAKNYTGSVGNAAVQQAISAKAFYGCDDAMVVTNSFYTKSAIELAESANVRLVDRAGLQKYLDDYNQKMIESFETEDEDEHS